MSSGDLEKSLRDDIENYVHSRMGGLRDEVARLQSQLNEAFTRLSERIENDSQSDASLAVAVSEHMRNARNAGIESAAERSTRARSSSEVAIIKAAIDDLDGQRTQSDILSTLVNRAASFAPRVAFFVVKQDRATGWRARGLEGTVGDDAVREISLPLSSDTLLGEVARTRSTWSGGPGQHAEDHSIFGHFGDEPPRRIVAVPLVAREKAVAVLYADSASQDADAINLEALEALVKVAGMAVELLATQRPAPHAPAHAPTPTTSAQHEAHAASQTDSAPAPPALSAEPMRVTDEEPASESSFVMPQEATIAPVEDEATAAESTPSHAESEHAFAGQTPAMETAELDAGAWGGGVGADGAAESTPATAAAPGAEVSPLGASRRQSTADMDFPIEVRDEEKRYHNEARRFARLLVSEIKLYNEQKVQDGRDAGDLYNRLRDDIDRSRQMYDKRVRSEVAGRYDYFHQELVTALAAGDPAKLGDGYPGATVSV